MSRYLLLFILNAPFVILGFLNATVRFKLSEISLRHYAVQVIFLSFALAGLALAGPFYDFLFSNQLTQTEPLSLFDVVQITAIVILFYSVGRIRSKAEAAESRLRELHQELSIRLSAEGPKK